MQSKIGKQCVSLHCRLRILAATTSVIKCPTWFRHQSLNHLVQWKLIRRCSCSGDWRQGSLIQSRLTRMFWGLPCLETGEVWTLFLLEQIDDRISLSRWNWNQRRSC